MNTFNPSEKQIRDRLDLQRAYIQKKKFTQDKNYKAIFIGLEGFTVDDSSKALQDTIRNMFQSFFKGLHKEKKCEHCDCTEYLQRAHHRGSDRPSIVKNILSNKKKEGMEIVSADIVIKEFLMAHTTVPIWYLCKQCHKVYDSQQIEPYEN